MGSIIALDNKGVNGSGFPSPVDGSSTVWPLDYWATYYERFAAAGITAVKPGPLVKGASMGAGFDPYDHYDFGSKVQSGRRQTRTGSREQAQRNFAIAFRVGMDPAIHLVHHHVDGGINQTYSYLGADGVTKNGRFPKDASCFWKWSASQQQNPDHVPDPTYDGGIWSYGDEFRWLTGFYGNNQGSNGEGYVANGLINATIHQLKTLGARQIIIDDLKGTNANYIAWLCNTLWEKGLIDFAAGEYFEGDRSILYGYETSYPVERAYGCFDFSQRFSDQNWCNSPGGYDMRQMLWNGLYWLDPFKALTFLDDIDTVGSEPVWRVWQGNAGLLARPGYPMIFGQHCFPASVGGFGLMDQILNLSWFREKFCAGPFTVIAATPQYVVYHYPQWPGCVIALGNVAGDFNNPSDWTKVTGLQTAYWGGTWLHDYAGLGDDYTVGPDGTLEIWIPPADTTGRAFRILAPGGFDGAITPPERITRQTFFCADDLDTPAATPEGVTVTYIWCDVNTPVYITRDQGYANYSLAHESGAVAVVKGDWKGQTQQRGWHKLTAYSLTGGSTPCSVLVEYYATRNLLESEFGDPAELQAKETITVNTTDPKLQLIYRSLRRGIGKVPNELVGVTVNGTLVISEMEKEQNHE